MLPGGKLDNQEMDILIKKMTKSQSDQKSGYLLTHTHPFSNTEVIQKSGCLLTLAEMSTRDFPLMCIPEMYEKGGKVDSCKSRLFVESLECAHFVTRVRCTPPNRL